MKISTTRQHRPRPLKRFGQNFLASPSVVKKMVSAAGITAKDTVLEIGPGTGVLTRALSEKAKRVIAVEKDPRMVEILQGALKGVENVKIIRGDILRSNFQFSISNFQTYKVVANLPFYIASPAIRMLLEAENPPSEMTLIVQKEVAQRICASPHRYAKRCGLAKPPRMNILAVSVQVYAEPKIISYVPKAAFWPQPKVDGAILQLKVKPARIGYAESVAGGSSKFKVNRDLFFRIVKAGFSHPRKQLLNTLSGGLQMDREKVMAWLGKNSINPKQRAQTLSIEDWLNLTARK